MRALSHQAITVVDTVSKQTSQGSLAPADAPAADVIAGCKEEAEEEAAAVAGATVEGSAPPRADAAAGVAEPEMLWAEIAAALPSPQATVPRGSGGKHVYDREFLMRHKSCNKCPEELLNRWSIADLQASRLWGVMLVTRAARACWLLGSRRHRVAFRCGARARAVR